MKFIDEGESQNGDFCVWNSKVWFSIQMFL